MDAQERQEIQGGFRYELNQFSKNKIDPLILAIAETAQRAIKQGERQAADNVRIGACEGDIVTNATAIDKGRETNTADHGRMMKLVVLVLLAILMALLTAALAG